MNGKFIGRLSVWVLFLLLGSSGLLSAATYELKTITAEVEQAISGRQARYGELQQLKANGTVGENNKGYVEAMTSAPGVRGLVDAENRNRKTIYRAIVSQNNLGAEGLSVVENVFADVQREKARPGDSIQQTNGQWTQKS